MHQRFELLSPEPPEVVRDRLARFGADWRDSRIDPRLRAQGLENCTITLTGDRFEVRPLLAFLEAPWPLRTAGWFRARGTVERAPAGARLRVRVGPTPVSAIAHTLSAVVLLGLWVCGFFSGMGTMGVAFGIIGVGIGVSRYLAGLDANTRLLRGLLEAVLASSETVPPNPRLQPSSADGA